MRLERRGRNTQASFFRRRVEQGWQRLEPWLRGTLTDVPVVERALLHSLQMAEEDTQRWCGGLNRAGIAPATVSIAFGGIPAAPHCPQPRPLLHLRGRQTPHPEQFAALRTRWTPAATAMQFSRSWSRASTTRATRLQLIGQGSLDRPIGIGRKGLPTTLGGLLVHAAEHTQRHVGQAITTAKVVIGLRCDPSSPA